MVDRRSNHAGGTRGWLSLLFATITVLGPLAVGAQVRPDSVRRDSVRTALPLPDRLRDSLRADSIRNAPATGARAGTAIVVDSAATARARALRDSLEAFRAGDTVRAPIARYERTPLYDLTERLRFTREQVLSSGAINLADLLDRVPGMTTFRSSWIAGQHVASYLGDFRRVRYFVDGVELDAIQPRDGGVLDLDDVPIWTIEELTIERAPEETRVWMRSWSTERTIPFTRADVYTGDLNTNGFRALFARRYRNGFALQFGGEQAATQTGRVSAFSTGETASGAADGSNQIVNARLGWSRGRISADVYATGSSRDRDPRAAREGFGSLPAFKGSRREAFVRVGYGDTSRGFWTQGVVGFLRTRLEGIAGLDTAVTDTTMADSASADTVRGRTQQVLTVGYRTAGWQLTLTDRVRPITGKSYHAPMVRASVGDRRYSAGLFAEDNAADSVRRVDAFARATPFRWLVLSAAFSDRRTRIDSNTYSDRSLRVEGGVRYRQLLVGGGIVKADEFQYRLPVVLGSDALTLPSPNSTGFTVSVSGPVYKDLRLDVQTIRWNSGQFGRPRAHIRAELALISEWRSRFPLGQFGIDARLVYDVRDPVPFYFAPANDEEDTGVRLAAASRYGAGQLEIRIQRARIFYQYRNLTGRAYEQIPGITLPPAVQIYGVRWEFFN